MDLEIALFDESVGPGTGNELALADKFARAFDQSSQDVERAAAKTKRLVAFEQKMLSREQAKGAEANCVVGRSNRPIGHLYLT
jgi:hypothetical protein